MYIPFSAKATSYFSLSKIWRLFFVVSCCICFFNICLAQNSFSSTQILARKINAPGQSTLQNTLYFLENNTQQMPLIEEYTFRTETDELDAARQGYTFRLNFSPKTARAVQDKINKQRTQYYRNKNLWLTDQQCAKKYEAIANWHFADLEQTFLLEKKQILEDKKTIYLKMLNNSLDFDISQLLKTQSDLHEIDEDLLGIQHKKKFARSSLFPKSDHIEKYTLKSDNWIGISQMKNLLHSIITSEQNNLRQVLQQDQIHLARLDLDMEVAETKQVLEFVQFKYAARPRLDFHREFSFGFSLRIPTKSTNRLNINEAQLDLLDEQLQYELISAKLNEAIATDYAKFVQIVELYELNRQHIQNTKLEESYHTYLQKGNVHPLTLLLLKENILRNKRKLLKLEKEACLLFIDILYRKGQLSRPPLTNYLSSDLEQY